MNKPVRFAAVIKCIEAVENESVIQAREEWGGLIEEAREEMTNMNRVIDAAWELIQNEDDISISLPRLRKTMQDIGWRVR